MITRSRKFGKEIQAVPLPVEAKATRKIRKAPGPQGKAKKQPPQKRERKAPGRKPWAPDLQKIEELAQQGLKDKEIAALSGISHQRFCTKKGELSELDLALSKGRAQGASAAATALWKAIEGGDFNAIKFYLERRAGWTAKQVIERLDLESLSDEELLALLEERSAN